jgi:hypothetical protein
MGCPDAYVNFVMLFVLGAKGNSWAWQNRKWESVEHFKATQRKWAIAGALLILAFIAIFFVATSAFKNSDAFKVSLATLEANSEFAEIIGTPISTGIVMGSIKISASNGSADLSFSVSGPKGDGKVYVEAIRDMEKWHVGRMVLVPDNSDKSIELKP